MSRPRHSLGGSYVYEYSLDVVTNGSEALEPTVFLSVSRYSKPREDEHGQSSHHECQAESLVRYAVLGLTDMTARLVADQRISWANTKAVFCNNNHRHGGECCPYMGVNGGGLWGIPGILLALHQAGASEVTVVTGNEQDSSNTEAIVELLEAHKTHPQIRIAAVPLSEKGQTPKWYKVYEDPYLLVHGICAGRLERLVYLFTCKRHQTTQNYTVAVLPCPHSWQIFLDIWGLPESRLVIENGNEESQISIEILLAIGDMAKKQKFLVNVASELAGAAVFICPPEARDGGILLRANESLQAWQGVLPNNIMWHQPPNSPIQKVSNTLNGSVLSSCSSVLCRQPPSIIDRRTCILKRNSAIPPEDAAVQSLKAFFGTPAHETKGDNDENKIHLDDLIGDNSDENEIDIESTDTNSTGCPNGSERERRGKGASVLDPPAEVAHTDCPYMLVLGTGCAAPSPLRGSSGYGLLLPQLLDATNDIGTSKGFSSEVLLLTSIIECGEGTVNALQRHLPFVCADVADPKSNLQMHLRHVKFIWVSHAHYDHYGGLPAVVSKIHEARVQHKRRAKAKVDQQAGKQARVEALEPSVLVVAPRKVLDYLNIALQNCGQNTKPGGKRTSLLFQGYTHHQTQSWWPALASTQLARLSLQPTSAPYAYRPFSFWTNVRVEHSCFNAFGFVTGLRVPRGGIAGDYCGGDFRQAAEPTVTLAYSGDSRPCWNFVQHCRSNCGGELCYLLHEASFDEADQDKALEKKHSSLSEALKVAEDVKAHKVILTHFSQRYTSFPPMKLPSASIATNKPVVTFAMDGMMIPLL